MLVNFAKLRQSFIGKIVFQLLFGLLAFSFVAWGISDVFRQSAGANDAAKVGKIHIPAAELDQSYRQYLNNLRARGMAISNEQAKSMQLAESVLKAKIQRELFSLATRDMNLIVGDDAVAKEIRKQKAFQNEKGEFDRKLYTDALKQNRLNEADYVENLRLDTMNNFVANILKTNAIVPDALVVESYRAQNQTRSADVRIVSFASVNAEVPSNDVLAKYLAEHEDRYRRPEMRKMTVAILPQADFAKAVPVSDDEAKAAYEQYKDELTTPEERNIQFISLPDQKKAQAVAEAARGGQKLLDAAKTENAGDVKLKTLDHVKPGTLPEELDKAVFKMGRAETSDAIQTPLGWYVVQILAVKRAEQISFADAKDRLVKGLREDRANDALPKTITALDDALAGGASLDELKKTYPLKITELKPVAQNAIDETGAELNTPHLKEILKAGFDLPKGQSSSPIELDKGDYLIVRLDDIMPAHLPALSEISGKVAADWKNDNQEKLAFAKAEELRKSWAGNNAQKPDTVLANIKRDSTVSDTKQSPDLTLAVFDLKKVGDVALGKVANGVAIAKLTAINNVDAKTIKPEALAALRTKMAEDAGEMQFNGFLNAVEKKYNVTINRDVIDRLYSAN